MDVVTKATATVMPAEDSKSKHGEFDVILSTNSLDRDGDELHPDEWKTPLPDKITFDSDHGMSVATCVGSGKPFINDSGQLQVRGTFASTPHGQAVRTLVNEGHIDSVSVAFMDRKTQKSGKPERELLNGAFVAVGANPEARVLASKSVASKSMLAEMLSEYIDDSETIKKVEARVKALSESTAGTIYVDIEPRIKDAANYKTDEMAAINDMFQDDALDSDDRPQRKEYWQGVHDVAVKLGAGCPYSDPQATEGVLNASNRSADTSAVETKSSPTESADEAAAADQKSAAADESADDVALLGKSLAIRLGLIDS